jgi:hypothetical protein
MSMCLGTPYALLLLFSLVLRVLRSSVLTVPRIQCTQNSTTAPGKCTPPCCPRRNERLRLGALPSCSSYPFAQIDSAIITKVKFSERQTEPLRLSSSSCWGASHRIITCGCLSTPSACLREFPLPLPRMLFCDDTVSRDDNVLRPTSCLFPFLSLFLFAFPSFPSSRLLLYSREQIVSPARSIGELVLAQKMVLIQTS